MDKPNFICPLLATNKVYCVRQYKTALDAGFPRWIHVFRRLVFVPLHQLATKLMGITAEFSNGGWCEGQQAFTREEDAIALLIEKGPGWHIEPLPLNGCLPDGSCTFEGQKGTDGHTIYQNGSRVLPVALPSEIATLQHAMAATSRALNR